jgi:predicted ATPase
MLKRIRIGNYKCLRDVTVDLGDFTILIGPNDSGKSSFLDTTQLLGQLLQQGSQYPFGGQRSLAKLVWRKDPKLSVLLEVTGTTDQHEFTFHVELPVEQRASVESLEWDGKKLFFTATPTPEQVQRFNLNPKLPVIEMPHGAGQQIQQSQIGMLYFPQFAVQNQLVATEILGALRSSRAYQFDPSRLSRPSVPQQGTELDASGSNIAAVLDVLQNSADRSEFDAIQKALREAVPSLRGLILPPAPQPSEGKVIEFILAGREKPPVTIPASQASTGALLLTAYFTLAYADSPTLLLFDEPETGLHPFRLQMVLDLLRKISCGKVGNRKRQVIITTHSPLLLNFAKPEEVRVFVRHPDEGTRVIPMIEVPDIDRLTKEFALGELWYLLGEEKLFESQPKNEKVEFEGQPK